MRNHGFRKAALAPLFVAASVMSFSGVASADDDDNIHIDPAFAEACDAADGEVYAVKGKVETVNASETTQIGTIKLALFEDGDDREFSGEGNLVGTITGSPAMGVTILSHTAQFLKKRDRSDFVTAGDVAVITGIRAVDDQGTPCSFFVDESITKIASGAGFFANVPSVNIRAEGYVSFCAEENRNAFKLSGEICVRSHRRHGDGRRRSDD